MFAGFMLHTWLVATVVALVAGVVGLFVVVRGSAFAAHALPLGAFPGAAAATLLRLPPGVGLAAFALLGVAGIARLGRRGARDVATALTLVTLLGLGALCLSLTSEYSAAIYALLFGQVLGISARDVVVTFALGAVALAAAALLYRPLLLSSVSPDLAAAQGIAQGRMDLWFLGLLALATVMTLPVVGALLVFSLLVGPPAAARAVAGRPLAATFLSAGIALAIAWAAIALAYVSNWPVGFFVGTLCAAAYAAGRGAAAWRSRRARQAVAGAA